MYWDDNNGNFFRYGGTSTNGGQLYWFGWIGFGAPRKTPTAIVDLLNKSINEAIAEPTIKSRLLDLGGLVTPPNSPADFAKFITGDTEKWIKVVKFANLKPE